MAKQSRKSLGKRGEQAALRYFEQQGYRLLEQNFRSRSAEVDLILQDRDVLVFCEVKTRQSETSGQAAESYGATQQKRLRKAIQLYLAKTDWDGPLRVDVLALQKQVDSPGYKLKHFQDALEFQDSW